MTAAALPRRTNSATARCPRFGAAAQNVSSMAKRRRQVSRRASSEARNSAKSIGAIRVQMPPGLRKSGIPDSVLMPAPVKTTARPAPAISPASAAISRSGAIAAAAPGSGRRLIPVLLDRRGQLVALHRKADRLVPAAVADIELHRVGTKIFQVLRPADLGHRGRLGVAPALRHRDRLDLRLVQRLRDRLLV